MQVFTFLTPPGWMAGVWTVGLKALVLPHESLEAALRNLAGVLRLAPSSLPAQETMPAIVNLLVDEVERYFRGENISFSVPVDWSGYTSFQCRVLKLIRTIPYGEVRSYGQVARAAGCPQGARAVGGVMRANRTPLIIPCHRVIASDGSLGGFNRGGGIKKYLLDIEEKTKRDGLF